MRSIDAPQGVAINAINTINQNPLKSLTNTPMFSGAINHAVNHWMLGANQAIVGRPRFPSFRLRHSMPLSFARASRTSPRLRRSIFANAPTLRVIWLSVMPPSPAVSILVKTALQQASNGPSAMLALNILMVSVA